MPPSSPFRGMATCSSRQTPTCFPTGKRGNSVQKKQYYPLESRNTKLTQRQCSNSTSKKATKETFVSSKTQSRKKERKPLCWSKKQNGSLRTHTNTTTVKSSPHKQTTNKQAVRRGGDRKTANLTPKKTQKSVKFEIDLKRRTQRKQQERKSQRKIAIAPRESRPNGGDKNGNETELLLQRSRWRQGLCLWAPALVWKSRDVGRWLWRNGWTRCARVVSRFMPGNATPRISLYQYQ
jgi:hypothetical protein